MAIVALDPTSGPIDPSEIRHLAPRPASLKGQRLGVVVNGLGHSEKFLDLLAQELVVSDDLAGVVKVVKSSVSVPPDPGDWARLTEGATVAITGFGG